MSDQSMDNNNIIMTSSNYQQDVKKPRPPNEQPLNCPRCDSTNTKFCYYNNYSLTQPRYFCKSCRRYWTKGGTLRNVPVGGGCRKNKRSSSKRSTLISDQQLPLPPLTYENTQNDLTLAFARLQKQNNNNVQSFDLLGSTHCDQTTTTPVYFDSLTTEFVDTQNFYYGFDQGYNNGHELMNTYGEDHHQHQQVQSYSTNNSYDQNGKANLMGFPWLQMNGGDGGRSPWHGLINTALN
ncbi:hypothetical protein ACFE04_006536 [Oxalis oulophora]